MNLLKSCLLTGFSLLLLTPGFAQKYRAYLTTEDGTITMMLYDQTPLHRDNFIKLCKEKFYDSTLFHRVIPQFMIQAGDPESRRATPEQMLGSGSNGYRIPAEFNNDYIHKRGALAAARDNNPEKASSGCQFYIVDGKKFPEAELTTIQSRTGATYTDAQKKVYETSGGAPHLDGNYTVFGEVIDGMDIVDKIAAQARNKMDRPDSDQRILKLKVKKKFLFFWL